MWPTQGWTSCTPEDQGFDSAKLAEGLQSLVKSGSVDSLLIVRNGYVILDAYFYPYDSTLPHKLASITKSVMTTLIGIAADQGRVHLDRPILTYFPRRKIANPDARKQLITLRHLVSMRNGFESGGLAGDALTLTQMRSQADWVQAALDRPMAETPGTQFCYDSPGMHLLSAILQEATGQTAFDFSRENLFEPLGIREVMWQSDPQGYTDGWGNLFLKPCDAAKIGYLWLHNGLWESNQIISATWVADSIKPWSHTGANSYGYGWWISQDGYYAYGRGGQHIRVYPAFNTIVVAMAGGIEFHELEPVLAAGLTDIKRSLPANPAGVAQLNVTLTTLAQPTSPYPVQPLPKTVQAISGKTVMFEANAAGAETLQLAFTNAATVTLTLNRRGKAEHWIIGLDGTYRVSSDGLARRGFWADDLTFTFEVFEIGPRAIYRVQVDQNYVTLDAPMLGLRWEGQIEDWPSTAAP